MKTIGRLAILVSSFVLPVALFAECDMRGAGQYGSHGGTGTVLFLASLALGYWVLRTVRKDKDQGWFKWVSYGTGLVILLGSLGGLICGLACHICSGKKAMSPASSQSADCPFHKGADTPAAKP